MNLYVDEMESPLGPLTLISNGEKMVRIDYGFMKDLNEQQQKWASRYFHKPEFIDKPDEFTKVKAELRDYFDSKQYSFSIKMEFYGTEFQKKVWQALFERIPFGKTKTYKDIAEAIGNPKAVRAVGGAVNKNPFAIVVPCHRVIGTNGKMVGYNGGLDKKEFLLQHEKL
ncbi:methylated-DNA--[protein]-cysteine S-methyltransferase [Oceanobacillus salinisoli]|uniref:methylated-DNA--[protein]-cysteine S-methyltransferase n=1 Tax=Oceanobacillus salinisoli TaxID=2678611 RepID=UPI001E63420A|nr:methylated-DNA--[protein]-cysteine S-methyltransferase [Oceanobacillus salinisoli]